MRKKRRKRVDEKKRKLKKSIRGAAPLTNATLQLTGGVTSNAPGLIPAEDKTKVSSCLQSKSGISVAKKAKPTEEAHDLSFVLKPEITELSTELSESTEPKSIAQRKDLTSSVVKKLSALEEQLCSVIVKAPEDKTEGSELKNLKKIRDLIQKNESGHDKNLQRQLLSLQCQFLRLKGREAPVQKSLLIASILDDQVSVDHIQAALEGDDGTILKELIKKKPQIINDRRVDGKSVLQLVMESKSDEVLKFVLNQPHCDVYTVNLEEVETTPEITLWVQKKQEEVQKSFTALEVAFKENDFEEVKALVENKDVVNKNGDTLWMRAVQLECESSQEYHVRADRIQEYIKDVQLNKMNNKGINVLKFALLLGEDDIACLLMKNGAENSEGLNACLHIADSMDCETYWLLIKAAFNPSLFDSGGLNSCLHIAALMDCEKSIEKLIEQGVSKKQKDGTGQYPYEYLSSEASKDIRQLLSVKEESPVAIPQEEEVATREPVEQPSQDLTIKAVPLELQAYFNEDLDQFAEKIVEAQCEKVRADSDRLSGEDIQDLIGVIKQSKGPEVADDFFQKVKLAYHLVSPFRESVGALKESVYASENVIDRTIDLFLAYMEGDTKQGKLSAGFFTYTRPAFLAIMKGYVSRDKDEEAMRKKMINGLLQGQSLKPEQVKEVILKLEEGEQILIPKNVINQDGGHALAVLYERKSDQIVITELNGNNGGVVTRYHKREETGEDYELELDFRTDITQLRRVRVPRSSIESEEKDWLYQGSESCVVKNRKEFMEGCQSATKDASKYKGATLELTDRLTGQRKGNCTAHCFRLWVELESLETGQISAARFDEQLQEQCAAIKAEQMLVKYHQLQTTQEKQQMIMDLESEQETRETLKKDAETYLKEGGGFQEEMQKAEAETNPVEKQKQKDIAIIKKDKQDYVLRQVAFDLKKAAAFKTLSGIRKVDELEAKKKTLEQYKVVYSKKGTVKKEAGHYKTFKSDLMKVLDPDFKRPLIGGIPIDKVIEKLNDTFLDPTQQQQVKVIFEEYDLSNKN